MFAKTHTLARWLRATRFTATFLFILAAHAAAQSATYYIVSMNGGQEVPPNPSPATGSGCFTLDTTGHRLLFHISFSGLTSSETSADLHGYAPSGMTAPVLFNLPLGSPTSGSIPTTPAFEQGFMQGLVYVEVNTVSFPSGEIRGRPLLPPLVPPTSYCLGDGTATACPCGNSSAQGAEAGCLNSFGTGGTLRANGVGSVGCDALVLTAAGLPPTTTALFFQGTGMQNGRMGTVFGDGLLCVAGTIMRLSIEPVSNGTATYPASGQPSVSVQGGVTSGGMRTYQVWYRNAAQFCQPEGFNLTNGLSLLWYM